MVVDASHGTTAPDVQRGGCRTGQQVTVPTPRQRHSATWFGALPLRTQRCYGKRAARGPSKRCLELLQQLQQRFPTTLLSLMLDHATRHKSRAVKRFLTPPDWVVLAHVAPYAPEYHPIARFWQWLKAQVYGATAFDTVDDVITRVRQLVWPYHEGWLTSTIHVNFTDYQRIL